MTEEIRTAHESLGKDLGLLAIFSISTGAMISSGLFILPGIAFRGAGPGIFISYFLGGLIALTGVFSISELATAMPKAGGDYFFITRSLGPMVGTVSGFLSWFALSLKTAFAVLGMAELAWITLGLDPQMTSIAVALVFIVLNIIGVREAVTLETIVVLIMLIIIGVYVSLGITKVNVERFLDFAPNGINAIMVGVGFVFVSYGGILKVASIAEEVRNPGRNIPLGLLLSLGTVTVIYSVAVFVAVGTMDPESLGSSITPLADSAFSFMGYPGRIALNIAALLAFVSTVNAGIMAASRYPLALARDGLMPSGITRVGRRGTPYMAILITGAFIVMALFLKLEFLVKAASTVVLMSYILTHLSIIVLRESRLENFRPSFKSPLYPWGQIFGMIFMIGLIADMGVTAIATSSAFIIMGVLFYYFYGKRSSHERYALLSLLSRITNSEFNSDDLEDELKGILSRRDDIDFDRFDRIVEMGPLMDLNEEMTSMEFFSRAAECFSDCLGLAPSEIEKLLREREEESNTAISEFVAIPHLVVPGEGIFRILCVRCTGGINFSERARAIKAVFVLAGSADERNFHLRALASIAQISQNENFEKRWMNARNQQALLDILHLSRRPRHSQ
ncbi:MAG: hypothetical protein CVV64_07145 [Candidatus Wallbacteria bacterium HGW-Wallbacteria-1]|jgi:amino acid transporter/mannitol/fructose-specific phosphotransferase system IIA component (Ntr-type)|uniref:PTS EIIA type-2 domain-containing protein n=1 Tax=Candidatus Wallbacteria bacterium HGW-Wallbacteria-1 TaxID=2013854 RepID=A0A2N1PT62_9BACT|nr:MAG: hypothetical protein CVV64_07145 [Candidatus Wallbacteria bacterium HGW-Wallbacteria-1]